MRVSTTRPRAGSRSGNWSATATSRGAVSDWYDAVGVAPTARCGARMATEQSNAAQQASTNPAVRNLLPIKFSIAVLAWLDFKSRYVIHFRNSNNFWFGLHRRRPLVWDRSPRTKEGNMNSLHLGPTVGELGRLGALRFPDREALIFGPRRLTYRALEGETSRLIQALTAHGLRRGDGIAVLSGNRVEVILASMAAQALGLRYTALHPLGGEDDHAFVLEDAEIKALVVDDAQYAARAQALKQRVAGLELLFPMGATALGVDIVAEARRRTPGPVVVEAQPEDIA